MFYGEQEYSFDDFYETTISAGYDVASSGDVDVYLETLPSKSQGEIILDPNSESKREVMYYHAKGSNYVSVKAINRGLGDTNVSPHTAGGAVQCNVVSGMFEGAYEMIKRITGGYVSQLATTGLYVYISPWSGYIGGTYYSYAGTGISGELLVDESTNYIYIDSTGSLVVNQSGFPSVGTAAIMLATVVTSSGSVTSIDNHVGKKMYWYDGISGGMVTAQIAGTNYVKKRIVAGDYVVLSQSGDDLVITAEPGTGSPNNWTNVNADLLPDVTETRSIGSSSKEFIDLYLSGDINFGGDITGNVVSSFNGLVGDINLTEGTGIEIDEDEIAVKTNDANLIYGLQYFN